MSGLVEALRALEVGAEWRQQAACRGLGHEWFFPTREGSTKKAKATCSSCPVQLECLEYAMETRTAYGVWGGMSDKERRRYRRRMLDRARRARRPVE